MAAFLRSLLVTVVSAALPMVARGETTTSLSLANTSGDTRALLQWNSTPGARHRVTKTTNLINTLWREVDLYDSTACTGSWLDPSAPSPLQFYRVSDPQPEVYDLDPPVLRPDATNTLFLAGQFIPTNALLQVQFEGGGGGAGRLGLLSTASFNLIPQRNGTWRVNCAPGVFSGTSRIPSAALVDGSGAILCLIDLDMDIEASGRSTDAPADTPTLQ